jgi:DNA polymerase iota
MAEAAADSKESSGRDIVRMFRRQDDVLKDFKVTVEHEQVNDQVPFDAVLTGSRSPEQTVAEAQNETPDVWEDGESDSQLLEHCAFCQSAVPAFAFSAHQRYHELSN